MDKNVIEVKNLTKKYRDASSEVIALDNISFSLKEGESVAIVGPSGSGKTTLLEIMAGLNNPSEGTVIIDNVNVHKGSDTEISKFRNKTLGFVFQMINLQDYFSAKENVALPLLAAGVDMKKTETRSEELLKMVGLKDRQNFYPKQLSGGEMQRVAVARALANNPKIIMADEPTGKLDKDNAEKVMEILMQIAKKGTSVIMITHDEKLANKFDRKIRIEHGRIVMN